MNKSEETMLGMNLQSATYPEPRVYYLAAREAAKQCCRKLDEVKLIEWDNDDGRFWITFTNGFTIFCTLHEAENGYSRVH